MADKSGNIVNMKRQARGREEQVYGFLYNTYSRLTQSRHYDYNGAALQANGRYNTDYTYDKRGNILTLDRNGRTSMANCTSWGAIDDLTYTYPANTNKLTNVTDAIVGAAGDEGFKNTTSTSYTYDTNGNLTYDADKGVTITYNHLNLPKKISYSGSKYLEMVYDAAGNMLSRRTVDTGIDDKIDYIAGIEYFDGVTQSIMHEEGRVYYTSPTTSRYEYTISDHLGNAHLMYTDLNGDGKVATPTEILWEGQYYPFGLGHNGSFMDQSAPEINYKYNGIELAKDLGINVNLATFRTLDPAVGRCLPAEALCVGRVAGGSR